MTSPKNNNALPLKAILKGLAMLAILAGLALAVRYSPLRHCLHTDWIDAHIRGQGPTGWLTYFSVASLLIAMGFPRQVISFLGGYAFGFLNGTATAQLVTFAGSLVAFLVARALRGFVVHEKFKGRVEKVDRFLHENTFTMTLIIRLSPVGNNLITNLLAGVSTIKGPQFLAGSFLGYLPQTLVFALLGSGFQVNLAQRAALSVALLLASTILGFLLYRKVKGDRPDPTE